MEIEIYQYNNKDQLMQNLDMQLEPFEYNSPFGSYNQTEDDRLYSNEDEEDNEDSKESTIDINEIKAIKRQRRISKKLKKAKDMIQKPFIYQTISSKDIFKICSGVFVTMNDGVLRFCYCLNAVSFGHCPQRFIKIEEKRSLGLVDITQFNDKQVPIRSINDCVDFLMKFNLVSLQKKEITDKLIAFQQRQQNIYKKNVLPKELKMQKESEYEEFKKHAYFYIQDYQKNNNGSTFAYAIGRHNFIDKEVDVSHSGLSKNYLALLGLDYDSFKSILLRNQKIDLIQEKGDIIKCALDGINLKLQQNKEDVYVTNISTFDGYPLSITFTTRSVTLSQKINNIFGKEYILLISEAYISPAQLQGLVQYRSKLMNNSSNLSLDEYIRKELSYLFEDVEYSVHSQQFLEKYYLENLQTLLTQEQYLTKKKQQINQCGYRIVYPNNNQNSCCFQQD